MHCFQAPASTANLRVPSAGWSQSPAGDMDSAWTRYFSGAQRPCFTLEMSELRDETQMDRMFSPGRVNSGEYMKQPLHVGNRRQQYHHIFRHPNHTLSSEIISWFNRYFQCGRVTRAAARGRRNALLCLVSKMLPCAVQQRGRTLAPADEK